jgi:pyruvate ferredoxin oxidoreductase alpha subunit
MLHQLEGSQAIARSVALCRPSVVSAYPISPQTHILEGLEGLVRNGKLENCEYMNVESEMGAISAVIGAEAAGVRSYTATSSQGLLYMMEAVYNASGLELPLVMTLGNRTIGAPINIWNDHSDAMAARDAGWLMFFAETNQEAVDLHILAFKIAEELRCPAIVNVDGFILTHAYEQVDLPSQQQVDEFLPPYKPNVHLDINNPMAIGAMVPPEHFMEVRHLAHQKQAGALEAISRAADDFLDKFGRNSGAVVQGYSLQNAETVVVTMGSVAGTIKDVVDELNQDGKRFGELSIRCYRPFPAAAIADSLKNAKQVIVVEKSLAIGVGGILSREVELAMKGSGIPIVSVVAGLGGRNITKSMLKECFLSKNHDEITFLGLDMSSVNRHIHVLN